MTTSVLERFAAVDDYPWAATERTGTIIRYITELLVSSAVHPIPGRTSRPLSVPTRPLGGDRTLATESGQALAQGITDPDAAEAIGFHLPNIFEGEQRVRDVLVVGEHREVIAPRHSLMVQP